MNEDNDEQVLYAGSSTDATGLAKCINACCVKEQRESVRLRGIGAGAISQIVKSIIIAEGMLIQKGVTITYKFGFKDVDSSDPSNKEPITAVEFSVLFTKR